MRASFFLPSAGHLLQVAGGGADLPDRGVGRPYQGKVLPREEHPLP